MEDNRNDRNGTENLSPDQELQQQEPQLQEELPTDANEDFSEKKKSSLWLKIGGGLVAAAVIAAVIFGILANTTYALLSSAIKNTSQAAVSSEPVQLLKSVFTQGSVEVALDLENLLDQMFGIEVEGQVSAKYISNLKDSRAAFLLALNDGSSTLADATLHANKDAIVLESDILFGKTAYGIGLNDLSDNLESSIFNPYNDSYYALDDELYDSLVEMDPDITIERYSEYQKVLEEATDEALAVLLKSIDKNVGIERDSDTIQFVDTTSKVTVLSVSADDKEISIVLREMLEWMKDSEKVRLLMNKTADLMDDIGEDPEDFIDDFYDELSLMLEDFDDVADNLEDAEAEVHLKLYITKRGKELVKVEFEVDAYDERNQVEMVAGPSLRDVELISLSYRLSGDVYYPARYTLSYTVQENSKDFYSAKLQFRDNEDRSSASVTWDKKDGEFRIKADDSYTVKGTMLYEKNRLTIQIRNISDEWDSIKPGLTIILNKQDSTPAVPSYTDILEMEESDFEYLGEDIYENVEDFLYEIGDAAYWMFDLFY